MDPLSQRQVQTATTDHPSRSLPMAGVRRVVCREVARLLFSFVDALARCVWNAASMTLWIAVVTTYAVTHFLASFLTRCGRVVGKIFSFVDDVVSAVLNVTRVVVEVVQKIGSAVDDFFSGRWDELGHESAKGAPTLRTPVVLHRLAGLADLDDRARGSTSFLTALGRLVRLASDDGDDDDDRDRDGGYCGFWRYARSIDLTRWVIADPLSAIFPGLCDESRGIDGVDFVFRDLPVILRWIGTVGVALFLALVTFRPLTLWAIRLVSEASVETVTWTFRGLRRCALSASPPDDPEVHDLCYLCLRDFALDGKGADGRRKTGFSQATRRTQRTDQIDDEASAGRRSGRAVTALGNGRSAHASCLRRANEWRRRWGRSSHRW